MNTKSKKEIKYPWSGTNYEISSKFLTGPWNVRIQTWCPDSVKECTISNKINTRKQKAKEEAPVIIHDGGDVARFHTIS